MFQSSITCRDYNQFVEICKKSKSEALKVCIRYNTTDQQLLREVIHAVWDDGIIPDTPFSDNECKIQNNIMNHTYE